MGVACCTPMEETEAPEPTSYSNRSTGQLVGVMREDEKTAINGPESLEEDDQFSSRQNSDQKPNFLDLVQQQATKEGRLSHPDHRDRHHEGEMRDSQSTMRNTLLFDAENPPTFQPGNKRQVVSPSLNRTSKSGETVLTFGKNNTLLEATRIDGRNGGDFFDHGSPQGSSLIASSSSLLRKTGRTAGPFSNDHTSDQVDKESSTKFSQLSAEYFDAKDRMSSGIVN